MKSVTITTRRRALSMRLLLPVGLFLLFSAASFAQTMGEMNTAMDVNDTLNSSPSGAPGPGFDPIGRARDAAAEGRGVDAPSTVPGPGPTLNNSSIGVGIAPPGGMPTLPSAASSTPLSGYPGLGGPTTFGASAQPGQPGATTPTPIPMIKVLSGRKVNCAVCGALLEDPALIQVPATDQDKYLDDGEHDNGIAGDGIRGNVQLSRDNYIGAECNAVKNRMINVVRNAESMTPMQFYRYHAMSVDPITAHPQMPKVLEKEEQRDEALRDWNNRFLADFRVNKNDPKSEFYQVYVPDPPLPPRYLPPPGYVSPQQRNKPTPGPGGAQVAPGMAGANGKGQPNIYNGDSVF